MASSSNPSLGSPLPYDKVKPSLVEIAVVYWAHHGMKPTTIQWIIAMALAKEHEPQVPTVFPEEYSEYNAAFQDNLVNNIRQTFLKNEWNFDDEEQKGQWLASGQVDLYYLDRAIALRGDRASKVAQLEKDGFDEKHQGRTWLEKNGFDEKHQGRTWISGVYKAARKRVGDYREHQEMASKAPVLQGPSNQDQKPGL